ncbi:hypothetical protein FHS95_002599 [Sphingomonas naasensis]|uniref:Uncharacterized protein n=1 Tax=Sphingomonas naasensis TaxID=1344951 RepID=A0A4S1WMV5_9SPHN|nr:DUF5908 family protein [Sphingomonas naasensis]NIJ20907.1 hypothetical protein [Sphingomonas naasensis]TGX43297.1 hypothetical protein E5A74_09030 [Sphingomonas naasensis]
MPLEIRQIAIQMRVAEDSGEAETPDGPRSIMELCDCDDDEGDEEEKQAALIERCVEAVLAELARRQEW